MEQINTLFPLPRRPSMDELLSCADLLDSIETLYYRGEITDEAARTLLLQEKQIRKCAYLIRSHIQKAGRRSMNAAQIHSEIVPTLSELDFCVTLLMCRDRGYLSFVTDETTQNVWISR